MKTWLSGLGLGALVVVSMAAAAWACTPESNLRAGPASGGPATAVAVTGELFRDGPLTVHWGSPDGPLLATTSGPSFSVWVDTPANASPGVYYIVGVQRWSNGEVRQRTAAPFQVTGPASTDGGTVGDGGPTSGNTSGSTSGAIAGGAPDSGRSPDNGGGTPDIGEPARPGTGAPVPNLGDAPAPASPGEGGSPTGSSTPTPELAPAPTAGGAGGAPGVGADSTDQPTAGPIHRSAGDTSGHSAASEAGTAPAVGSATVDEAAGEAVGTDPSVPGEELPAVVMPSPATAAGDLWSGFETSVAAQSLPGGELEPATRPGRTAGTGLLALGVLALVGLGTVAGLSRRKASAAHRLV